VAAGVCLVAMHACQKSSDVPTAPGTISAFQTATTLNICHRTGTDGTFVRMSISSSDFTSHQAHGDAPLGDAVPGLPGQRFDSECRVVSMAPVSVTFKGLAVNGDPITTYRENGVTVTAQDGPWEAMTGYGNAAPAIIFKQLASAPPVTGVVQVRIDGDLFAFASVDVYSSVTPIPYAIVGTRSGQTVLSMSGTIPNTFGRFASISTPTPLMVTELRIELTNPFVACCGNPMGLDNITIKR
jgi:hypothetical protein